MILADTHCHIHEGFGDDAGDAVRRARDHGVRWMLTLGVNRADSERALAFASAHDGVLAAAGVHPHDAGEATDGDLDALEAMAGDERVALIGEIGFDFYRDLSPRDIQRRVLERQLETARRVRKPVAIHARDAHDAMYPLLAGWARGTSQPGSDRPIGVMHYFSGDADLARRYIELGFMISVHTSVTHPKAAMLQDVARMAPLESIVLETDAPYGAPQRYRGKRNEPAYVVEAARAVAELRGCGEDTIAEATTRNAMRLLGIAVAAGGL